MGRDSDSSVPNWEGAAANNGQAVVHGDLLCSQHHNILDDVGGNSLYRLH